jgi:hypothetical protein
MIQCVIAKPLGLLLFINIETDFDQNNRILYMYDYATKFLNTLDGRTLIAQPVNSMYRSEERCFSRWTKK